MRPRLALVPGEPAGVGPELCLHALRRAWDADLVVYGDASVLQAAAVALGAPLPAFELVAFPLPSPVAFGQPDAAHAAAVIGALEAAGRACLEGRCDGLVTGPIHKASVNAGGIAYTGTTELLAQQAARDVVMMLARDAFQAAALRVALATTHLPLRAVPEALGADGIERTLRILDAALRRDFGIAHPRIAVLGLNPHAGEDGHLGREEIEIVIPVLERLRGEGMRLSGPLPADTAFLPPKLRDCDAVLAMYHDQGLPVLKSAGLERAVNITLGLPYPRVAVDHGTALDLAGKGVADPASLFAAIDACTRFARQRMAADARR